MSASRQFASLTADLLARKGQARPSASSANEESSTTWFEPQGSFQPSPRPGAFERVTGANGVPPIFTLASTNRPHRISLTLTRSEFEILGIAAVKVGINRKQIFRRAIDFYLEKLETDYRSNCHCISTSINCCATKSD